MSRVRVVWLLDVNVLIALTHSSHVHHTVAHQWFAARSPRCWATCAMTQLGFVRVSSHAGIGQGMMPAQALQALAAMTALDTHEYWIEAPGPLDLPGFDSPALVGHRQVSDAWLLGLAAQRQQVLATLDRGLLAYAQAVGLGEHVELVAAPTQAHEPLAAYGR